MLLWSLKVALVSILCILLVHHLLHFFTTTLTVPKIKDLVHSPTEKYQDIYNLLRAGAPEEGGTTRKGPSVSSSEYTLIDLLPKQEDIPSSSSSSSTANATLQHNPMKDELKNFLKSQLHKS